MGIFKNIKKKLSLPKEEKSKNKTEEIMSQRADIKMEIAIKLYNAGCKDEDIEEVLAIIQNAEDDIQIIKNSLIGTNINPGADPMKPLTDGKEQIRKRQLEMQEELNRAIARILPKNDN